MTALPTTLYAYAPFGRGSHQCSPLPPRRALKSMLAELEQQIVDLGYFPTGVACRSWLEGTGAVARISLVAWPGDMTRSLASWYEWQHPRWNWIVPPTAVGIAPALATIGGEAAHA